MTIIYKMRFTNFLLLTIILVAFFGCSVPPVDETETIIYSSGAEYEDGNYITDSLGKFQFGEVLLKTEDYVHSASML